MASERIHLGLSGSTGSHGGVSAVNGRIAEILRRRFPTAERPEDAALRVCSLDWDVPLSPRRLFVDHGSFADASFWAYKAPKLRTDDTLLVSSRVCLQVAERILEPPRPRMPVVPLFADTDLFHPPSDRMRLRQELEAEYGWPAQPIVLLVVAAYSRRKNLHLAVRFLHALRERIPGVGLVFVGSVGSDPRRQSYETYLRALARELGVASQVRFLDTLPHAGLSKIMAGADLLVHLSTCRLENFGLVVAEALASGLPVVAADWGGLRDLVEPGRTGLLARTYFTRGGPRVDWLSVVAEAADLLRDRGRWSEMCARAASTAREHFGLPAFEARLVRAVEEALRAPGTSSAPLRLSARGQDLMFTTIQLDLRHAGTRSTSEEYDRLLQADAELCRFLTAPAASSEQPPAVGPDDHFYPAVAFEIDGAKLRITDPAWPGEVGVDALRRFLVERSDGRRRLRDLTPDLPEPGTTPERVLEAARDLVAQGVLCTTERPRDATH